MRKLHREPAATVQLVGVCDIYEVGNWVNCYPWIKLGYKLEGYQEKYSDIAFSINVRGSILGYFMVYRLINVEGDGVIPLYGKKLVLCDFAVSARAYAKYGLKLINYLIDYATKNGYSAIEVKKNGNAFFLDFISRHYKLLETSDSLYFIIDKPKITQAQKHLRIYGGDSVKIEDVYFLYSLKFAVRKTVISLKLADNEYISVDRASGRVKLPSNVKISKDEVVLNSVTRSIIYLLCKMNKSKQKNMFVEYSLATPNEFELYEGDTVYVNKDVPQLAGDIQYVLGMMDRGVKSICSYIIDYDMNDDGFAYSPCEMSCYSIIERFTTECLSNATVLVERLKEKKARNEFNARLKQIKRFDFRFGNPFSGIKKLAVSFGEDVEISSNGRREKDVEPKRDEILRELELFNFIAWKARYDGNDKPKQENAWYIRLVLEGEEIEFSGLDDYPRVWEYVKWFVNKYSGFSLTDSEDEDE